MHLSDYPGVEVDRQNLNWCQLQWCMFIFVFFSPHIHGCAGLDGITPGLGLLSVQFRVFLLNQ